MSTTAPERAPTRRTTARGRGPAAEPAVGADVHTDSGYFAIVPEWLLDAKDSDGKPVSGNAIKLYAIIARYADQAEKFAHPSRRTLAERMGFSRPASVDPILQQLVDVGAVEIFERFDAAGDRTSNGYVIKRTRSTEVVRESAPPTTPDRTGGWSAAADHGGTPDRTTVVRETEQEPEPLEPEPSEPEGGADAPAPGPTCAQHPNGTTKACRRCGDARRAWDANRQRDAERVEAETPARRAPRYDPAIFCPHLQRRDGDCEACAREARQILELQFGTGR